MTVSQRVAIGLLACGLASVVVAARPAAAQDVVIGTTERIASAVLDENRKLYIYVPESYKTDRVRYPVLYVLDGDVHFHHVSGLMDFLVWSRQSLPMIVVAIGTVDRTRDFTARRYASNPGTGGADLFLTFLDREVFPFVENRYRTSGARILIGHSMGGSLALYTLFTRPKMFNAYIAIAPGDPLGDPEAAWVVKALPGLKGLDRKLLMVFGERDDRGASTPFLLKLFDVLKPASAPDLTWSHELVAGGDHWSIVHNAIYRGLTLFYPGWGTPPDATLLAGLEAIKAHFGRVSTDQPPEGALVDAARRLLNLGETDRAVAVMRWAADLRPKTAGPPDILGQMFEQIGDLKASLACYEAAYKIAQDTRAPGVAQIKTRLDRMRKALEEKKSPIQSP